MAEKEGIPLVEAVPVPVPYQPMAPVAPSQSHGFLATMDGLFVRQQLEVLEMISGCETKNRYNVSRGRTRSRWP